VVRKDRSVTLEMLTQPGPDAREVVGGNVLLLKDGRVIPNTNKDRHPRTAAGLNADRTKLVLLVVDGRKPGVAIGMNYGELAAEMLRLGCHDAINLDGGGSSVMAVREPGADKFQILNQPTDGRERAVANVLGVVVGDSAGQHAGTRN
jgi:exopolysaccharide biosynthesis protein